MAESAVTIPKKATSAVEATTSEPSAPPATSKSKFSAAVDWATELSIKSHASACGICTWRPWDLGSEGETRRALAAHIRRKHRDSIVDLFERQTLNLSTLVTPGDANDELLAAAGITETNDLDRYDRLAIPPAIRHQAELDGAEFRFVRKDRVDHFKYQGAEVVHLNGERGVVQPSTEDGILRANEMVCMRIPHELLKKREAQKEARLNSQLNSRAEEIQVKRDAYEKQTYDILRKDGKDHQTALQVARALTSRRNRERGRSESNLGMTIRDRHGERSY